MEADLFLAEEKAERELFGGSEAETKNNNSDGTIIAMAFSFLTNMEFMYCSCLTWLI
jgi:hypothetical protein